MEKSQQINLSQTLLTHPSSCLIIPSSSQIKEIHISSVNNIPENSEHSVYYPDQILQPTIAQNANQILISHSETFNQPLIQNNSPKIKLDDDSNNHNNEFPSVDSAVSNSHNQSDNHFKTKIITKIVKIERKNRRNGIKRNIKQHKIQQICFGVIQNKKERKTKRFPSTRNGHQKLLGNFLNFVKAKLNQPKYLGMQSTKTLAQQIKCLQNKNKICSKCLTIMFSHKDFEQFIFVQSLQIMRKQSESFYQSADRSKNRVEQSKQNKLFYQYTIHSQKELPAFCYCFMGTTERSHCQELKEILHIQAQLLQMQYFTKQKPVYKQIFKKLFIQNQKLCKYQTILFKNDQQVSEQLMASHMQKIIEILTNEIKKSYKGQESKFQSYVKNKIQQIQEHLNKVIPKKKKQLIYPLYLKYKEYHLQLMFSTKLIWLAANYPSSFQRVYELSLQQLKPNSTHMDRQKITPKKSMLQEQENNNQYQQRKTPSTMGKYQESSGKDQIEKQNREKIEEICSNKPSYKKYLCFGE